MTLDSNPVSLGFPACPKRMLSSSDALKSWWHIALRAFPESGLILFTPVLLGRGRVGYFFVPTLSSPIPHSKLNVYLPSRDCCTSRTKKFSAATCLQFQR